MLLLNHHPPPPPGDCDINPTSPECLIKYIPLAITGIALLAMMVAIIVLWRKLGSMGAVASAAGGVVSKGFAEVKHTILGGGGKKKGAVLAKLHVMVARRDLEGVEVKIYTNKTSIGRDPRLCDVLLYDEDEVSSVSGVHCTIQYDRGQFLITDDNSSNGTEVNGNPLSANSPQILKDGDVIVLGDIFHRGAKFRFEIVADVSQLEQNGSQSIVDPAPGSGTYGGETILDLGEDDGNHDTMYGDQYNNFLDSPPNNETDWLKGLE